MLVGRWVGFGCVEWSGAPHIPVSDFSRQILPLGWAIGLRGREWGVGGNIVTEEDVGGGPLVGVPGVKKALKKVVWVVYGGGDAYRGEV